MQILGKGSIGPNKFLSGLQKVASILLSHRDIKHDDLHAIIKENMSLDDISATKVIKCLAELAIFVSYRKDDQSALKPGETFYQPAFQAVIESLIAIELAETTVEGKAIPDHLIIQEGILEITATLLYVDYDILPAVDGIWSEQLLEPLINRLRCVALGSSHPEKTAKQADWVVEQLTKSMPSSRAILANLCFPLSRIPKHPLGSLLVHEVLASFKQTAGRDLFWSGLDSIPMNQSAIWEGYGPNPIVEEVYSLNEDDKFDGLPLLHAWNLASVDNDIVDRCSQNLTKWGTKCPSEFLKLFNFVMPTNDPQINEALFCCAYGIASVLKPTELTFVRDMTTWLLKNIFTSEGLTEYRSSIIRATGRAIVERALELGLISETEAQAARPPFSLKFEMLSLNKDAALEKESYGPIWHDLAWYVIKRAYEGFFGPKSDRSISASDEDEKPIYSCLSGEYIDYLCTGKLGKLSAEELKELEGIVKKRIESRKSWNETKLEFTDEERSKLLELLANIKENELPKTIPEQYYPDAAKILEEAKRLLGFDVGPHQLTLAAGIAFIEKLGWSKEVFYGKPNGGGR